LIEKKFALVASNRQNVAICNDGGIIGAVMARFEKSLRGKVVLGYLFGLLLMIGLVVVNWGNLQHLRKIVMAGEHVSRFANTILETRRYEKNFFLYSQDEDYRELLKFSEEAHGLLLEHRESFSLFVGEKVLRNLEVALEDYRGLFLQGEFLKPSERSGWEEVLRQRGHIVVAIAEDLSRSEHRTIEKALGASRATLFQSVVFVGIAGLAVSIFLLRLFVRPLKLIEEHMNRIVEGDFDLIPFRSQDRELVSLNRAFNSMLQELDHRQNQIVLSEKYASFGTLLFGVAHELNNPLSNILSSCQILQEEIEDASLDYKKELLSQIEGETERARDIVRSTLDYSRKTDRGKVELLETVYEAVRFVKGDLPPKVDIEVDIPDGLTVFADRQGLQQVFLNLLKNGIEALHGEGKISIGAKGLPEGRVEIQFTDTGEGMSQEVLSKIFDPFFTTKDAGEGSGLGLFIVHKITKENNGTVLVQSEKGYGTTFLIALPSQETDDGK
jgi:two-component system NtrC family sensor kinase